MTNTPKDCISSTSRTTRSSRSKGTETLENIDILMSKLENKPRVKSGKDWKALKRINSEILTQNTYDKDSLDTKVMKENVNHRSEKTSKTIKIVTKDKSLPSASSTNSLSSYNKLDTLVEKENKKATASLHKKSRLDILSKQIREEKKAPEISKVKDIQKNNKTEDKELTNVEVVDISSDSDLEDDEFRKIFANIDTNLNIDTSDITDTEELSSGETSETSSCILIDDGSEKRKENMPRNLKRCDNIPVLPKQTTITLVRRKQKPESQLSNATKSRKKSNDIEIVDLE